MSAAPAALDLATYSAYRRAGRRTATWRKAQGMLEALLEGYGGRTTGARLVPGELDSQAFAWPLPLFRSALARAHRRDGRGRRDRADAMIPIPETMHEEVRGEICEPIDEAIIEEIVGAPLVLEELKSKPGRRRRRHAGRLSPTGDRQDLPV